MKPVFLALMAALLLGFACAGGPVDIPDSITPAELIQRAQEAVDSYNYTAALTYYETLLSRFPDDHVRQVIAKYEVGFIYYKQGKFKDAVTMFDDVLEAFSGPFANDYPAWPAVLARKVKAQAEESLNGK